MVRKRNLSSFLTSQLEGRMAHIKVSEIVLGTLCFLLLMALTVTCHQLVSVTERSLAYEAGYVRARAKVDGYRELIGNEYKCDAMRREMLRIPPGPEEVITREHRRDATVIESIENPMPSLSPETTPSSEQVLYTRTNQRGPTQ